ncbi:MAG: YihY/virulence factor BrkB family protein [Bryobacterales bacterium]|nr:YihY/virulence factor BrkB family protein [Bryobacterales bacterium]
MAEAASIVTIVKRTFSDFFADDCLTLAASVSYYAIFSLPPLLLMVIWLAGSLFGQQEVKEAIYSQGTTLVGPAPAAQLRTMFQSASERISGGGLPMLATILALLFAATGVFAQVQTALNRTWHVQPDPERNEIWYFLTKRVVSFGLILGISFLRIVSLVVSTAVSAVGGAFASLFPVPIEGALAWSADLLLGILFFTILIAAIFKWMPDVDIAWREVWFGSFVTAVFILVGKYLIGFYLGQSDAGSMYGSAGALALIMIWVYYTSAALFLGAEFTEIWSRRQQGLPPIPKTAHRGERRAPDRAQAIQ